MIKVLIVDDSRVVQQLMTYLLSSDPDIQVIGVAGSGDEAIKFVNEVRPDLITMDIHMPGMDGYEATRTIMETVPTPVIIVSGSIGAQEVANSFKLLEAGALAVILRPPGIGDPGYAAARKMLIQHVKLMSEITVVKRFRNQINHKIRPANSWQTVNLGIRNIQLIAIGASTGGPIVLQTILSNLPKELPVPVLIVQHIARGFIHGFRDWLSGFTPLPVNIAKDGELLKPGNVYIAPDDLQMGILPGFVITLGQLPPENSLCPSVDFLFRSVAEVMGPNAIGVLLTGMGKDGANELKNMKDKGAVTIAQDEASCIVFGMPGEAVRIGAADLVLSADKIAGVLTTLCKNN